MIYSMFPNHIQNMFYQADLIMLETGSDSAIVDNMMVLKSHKGFCHRAITEHKHRQALAAAAIQNNRTKQKK